MNFKSDNIIGVHPQIMNAIIAANAGVQPSYGNDDYSCALEKEFSDIFETPVSVYLTNTGTAANSLALSALVPPYGAIYCHDHAHINVDESGAPEFFTSGAKLVSIPGDHGKLNADVFEKTVQTALSMRPHTSKPSCVSISQATESGTVYTTDELMHITRCAQSYKIPVHMDGARFANSLVYLNASPAEITWKAGIDVLSFGATKNGAMCAEAIVFFNKKYAEEFEFRQKRAGQMMSKMRFYACQFPAYFKDNLWLKNALHANNMAKKLEAIFIKHHFKIENPVEINEVFVHIPYETAQALMARGCHFYEWGAPGCNLYRFVTSCFTQDNDIDMFEKCFD